MECSTLQKYPDICLHPLAWTHIHYLYKQKWSTVFHKISRHLVYIVESFWWIMVLDYHSNLPGYITEVVHHSVSIFHSVFPGLVIKYRHETTIMISSFHTDRSRQTVWTLIRLLHSVCTFWTCYSMVKPPCSYFSDYSNFWGCLDIYGKYFSGLWSSRYCVQLTLLFEPCHEKTCLCHMRTTKTQISLRIRAVWSAPLLFAA